MKTPIQSISDVAEFLSNHRFVPPERDGWFSSYEIEEGIRKELRDKITTSRLYPALDYLLTAQPPAIEDSWMVTHTTSLPDLSVTYSHQEAPKKARRYYRALGSVANHIVLQVPSSNFTMSWQAPRAGVLVPDA